MARESEVEVTEMSSEMCSLPGVPGGGIEAMLGCLEGKREAAVAFGRMAVATTGAGATCVVVRRRVRGAVTFLAESDAMLGL